MMSAVTNWRVFSNSVKIHVFFMTTVPLMQSVMLPNIERCALVLMVMSETPTSSVL
ncbi:hypothetical protein E2C01_047352 [Portunus trituberculatus]|uniref:Uncharacterized protein n=1 Tax=Portunus trituberculatus TaxID=210409 RepID=A0A5B7G076_PORTR|nr:hypothetical protein [Portunus trituberculatus]